MVLICFDNLLAISYAYSYNIAPQRYDPKYNITISIYPNGYDGVSPIETYPLSQYYGLLVGAAFTVPISVCGIFMGYTSDRVNRSMMLGLACILWSAMTALSSIAEYFWLLVLCRIFLGVFESAGNPAAYSLLADYFPPEKRATANSIYMLGVYIGGALSSLTIVMITGVGWRWSFAIIGYIGIIAGILCLIFVQEPKRGRLDPKKKDGPTQP